MRELNCFIRWTACGLVFLSCALRAAPVTNVVQMGEAGTYYYFNPTNITINAGGTILWTNVGAVAHDASSRSNLWSSPTLPNGGTYSFTFNNAGNYPYYCFFHRLAHPEQTGTVSVVTAPNNPPPSAVTIANPTLSSGAFSFSFLTQTGYTYSAQFTPSLNPVSWFTFTNLGGNGLVVQVTDSSLTNASRYYRVSAQ